MLKANIRNTIQSYFPLPFSVMHMAHPHRVKIWGNFTISYPWITQETLLDRYRFSSTGSIVNIENYDSSITFVQATVGVWKLTIVASVFLLHSLQYTLLSPPNDFVWKILSKPLSYKNTNVINFKLDYQSHTIIKNTTYLYIYLSILSPDVYNKILLTTL